VIARVLDIGQEVRGENQVDVLVVSEIANQLEHLVTTLRVHPIRRLVEKEEIGVVDERLRELDALLHTGRVRFDVPVARFPEADVVEHFVGTLHRVHGGQARELPAIGDERHRIHAGDMSVAFRHVPEARPDLQRTLGDIQAEHRHAPLVRLDEPEQRLQHRALPGAVRAEQADGAARELGGDALERLVLPVHDRHAVEPHHGRGAGCRLRGLKCGVQGV
jgi:hypothetical protein